MPWPNRSAIDLFLWLLLSVAITLTIQMLVYIHYGFSNVPWRDQWSFIKELPAYLDSGPFWRTLWSPYWGHRMVIPRLVYLCDAKWFALSNAPLIVLILLLQSAETGLLAYLCWQLLSVISRPAFLLALAFVWNLLWSSVQMENFIWGFQIQFVLVYTGALTAVVLLSCFRQRHERPLLLGATLLAAFISSYSMANGVFIWPTLMLHAWLIGCRRRVILTIAFLGALVIGSYQIDYSDAGAGMGLPGILVHPLQALSTIALVLGGPLSNQSATLGEAAGWAGLGTAVLMVCTIRKQSLGARRWPSSLLAVLVFSFLTAASVTFGRISPAYVQARLAHGWEVLPSRYMTPSLLYWSALLALSLWHTATGGNRWLRWLPLLPAGIVTFWLTFGCVNLQLRAAEAWGDAFREMDAAASALLVDVPDQEYLQRLWPVTGERETLTRYLRQHGLAMFAEARARWLNTPLLSRFPSHLAGRCEGRVESVEPLAGTDGLRVKGWIWDHQRRNVPLDVVVVDGAGVIAGLGRSGILHHDVLGRSRDVAIHRAGWLAYVRPLSGPSQLWVYAALPAEYAVCPIGSFTVDTTKNLQIVPNR